MFKPLQTFLKFTGYERYLLLQVAVTLVVSCVRLRTRSIEENHIWACRAGSGKTPAKQLAWAVKIISRRVPFGTCLSRALALQHLLSANGQKSELVIGVRNSHGRFSAHAWLVCDDEILIGGDAVDEHKSLAAWSTHGASRGDRE